MSKMAEPATLRLAEQMSKMVEPATLKWAREMGKMAEPATLRLAEQMSKMAESIDLSEAARFGTLVEESIGTFRPDVFALGESLLDGPRDQAADSSGDELVEDFVGWDDTDTSIVFWAVAGTLAALLKASQQLPDEVSNPVTTLIGFLFLLSLAYPFRPNK
jgi:hypothetical protein